MYLRPRDRLKIFNKRFSCQPPTEIHSYNESKWRAWERGKMKWERVHYLCPEAKVWKEACIQTKEAILSWFCGWGLLESSNGFFQKIKFFEFSKKPLFIFQFEKIRYNKVDTARGIHSLCKEAYYNSASEAVEKFALKYVFIAAMQWNKEEQRGGGCFRLKLCK